MASWSDTALDEQINVTEHTPRLSEVDLLLCTVEKHQDFRSVYRDDTLLFQFEHPILPLLSPKNKK